MCVVFITNPCVFYPQPNISEHCVGTKVLPLVLSLIPKAPTSRHQASFKAYGLSSRLAWLFDNGWTHNPVGSCFKRFAISLRLWLHIYWAGFKPQGIRCYFSGSLLREMREQDWDFLTLPRGVFSGTMVDKILWMRTHSLLSYLSRMCILGELSQLRGPLEYRHGSVGCYKWTTSTSRHDLELTSWALDL